MRSILIFRRVTFEDNKSRNLICTKSVRLLINSRNLKYIQACTADVRAWMVTNRLKINDRKTELLIVGSCQSSLLHSRF